MFSLHRLNGTERTIVGKNILTQALADAMGQTMGNNDAESTYLTVDDSPGPGVETIATAVKSSHAPKAANNVVKPTRLN